MKHGEAAEGSSRAVSRPRRGLAATPLFFHSFLRSVHSCLRSAWPSRDGSPSAGGSVRRSACVFSPSPPPVRTPGFPRGAPELCPIGYRVMSFTRGSARARRVMKRLLSSLLPGAARGQSCYFTKQTPSERCALAMRGRSQENVTFPFEC